MTQIINNKGSVGEQINLDCKGLLDEIIEEMKIDNGFKKENNYINMKNADKLINPILQGTLGNMEDFGLTKREYFVAQAMKGVLASEKLNSMSNGAGASFFDFVAFWSISIADEVLRQLEETEKENKQKCYANKKG